MLVNIPYMEHIGIEEPPVTPVRTELRGMMPSNRALHGAFVVFSPFVSENVDCISPKPKLDGWVSLSVASFSETSKYIKHATN